MSCGHKLSFRKIALINQMPVNIEGTAIKNLIKALPPVTEPPVIETIRKLSVFIGSVTLLLLQPHVKYPAVKKNTSNCTKTGSNVPSELSLAIKAFNREHTSIEKNIGPTRRMVSYTIAINLIQADAALKFVKSVAGREFLESFTKICSPIIKRDILTD